MPDSSRLRSLLASATIVVLISSRALAGDISWINPSQAGFFNNRFSWTGGVVPDADDIAVFDRGGTDYLVFLSSDVSTAGLAARKNNVALFLQGHTWTMPQDYVDRFTVGGFTGLTQILVSGGTIETGRIVVGKDANSEGRLSVNGTQLTSTELIAGMNNGSRGNVLIDVGANVSTGSIVIGQDAGSSGEMTVTGPGSHLSASGLGVGFNGYGYMEVRDSANVDVVDLYIGGFQFNSDNTYSTGVMSITDSTMSVGNIMLVGTRGSGELAIDNSTVTSGFQLQLGGYGGRGVLTVKDGSVLQTSKGNSPSGTSGTIAASTEDSWGSVEISGSGSKWLQDGNFSVGSVGAGQLRIEDQGYVESKDAQVARASTASAEVHVDGQDSRWVIQDRLIIGGAFTEAGGVATVNVSNNGRIEVGNELHLWESGTLDVSQQGSVIVGDPVLRPASTVSIADGAILSGTGTIIGDVLVGGGRFIRAGTLAPGASPGKMTIDGSVLIDEFGILSLELAGTTEGLFDQLVVTGSLVVLGTIEVTLLNDFTPQVGDTFNLFNVGGTLDLSQTSFVLPNGLFLVSLGTGEFQVSVVPEANTFCLTACGSLLLMIAARRHIALRRV